MVANSLFDPKNLDSYPKEPGVYLMKDLQGEVLYVGKAKNLKNRLKQYFAPGRDGRAMIPYLIAKVTSIETIVVFSEKEALLLENNLIKLHQPRYNALLKDDKGFIAIKISLKEKWPLLKIVRFKGAADNKALYFGPYTNARSARQTINLIHKLFPLRQCSNEEFARRTRPCLLYEMKRCIAPCVDLCTQREYEGHLKRVVKFLKGHNEDVLKDLYEEMEQKSEALEFEKASQILQAIRHIEKTIEVQHVDKIVGSSVDAIGIYRQAETVVLSQLIFRRGKLMGSKNFDFYRILEDDQELISSFLLQQYGEFSSSDAQEIFLPLNLKNITEIEELISAGKAKKIKLHIPQKGEKKVLQKMAESNAKAYFKSQTDEKKSSEQLLLDVQEQLQLTNYPAIVDCFDTSNTSGSEPVASMVSFVDGKKDSKRYRLYKLDSSLGSDDYGGLKEAIERRYKRAKPENKLPDLIIVDGGKGQLSTAKEVLASLDIVGIDLISLAKEFGRHDKGLTEEVVHLSHLAEPVTLPKHSAVLFFLQRVRDEVHRFTIGFHRKRLAKKSLASEFDQIKGIGPKKKKALIKAFGSLKGVDKASLAELENVPGISKNDAMVIFNRKSLS